MNAGVLRFAARQKLLTPELAEQTGNLALHRRSWSRGLFEILTECYAVNPSRDILKAICAMLIAGDQKNRPISPGMPWGWPRICGLPACMEYYMETMDEYGIEKMPQIIRMYFIYNNTLNYP